MNRLPAAGLPVVDRQADYTDYADYAEYVETCLLQAGDPVGRLLASAEFPTA